MIAFSTSPWHLQWKDLNFLQPLRHNVFFSLSFLPSSSSTKHKVVFKVCLTKSYASLLFTPITAPCTHFLCCGQRRQCFEKSRKRYDHTHKTSNEKTLVHSTWKLSQSIYNYKFITSLAVFKRKKWGILPMRKFNCIWKHVGDILKKGKSRQ